MALPWRVAGLGAIALFALGSLPLIRPPVYFLSFATTLFMNIALAEAWTILGGYAGYMSFGHVAFFGIGAYTTGMLLLKAGLSPFVSFPLAGATAGTVALLIGFPILRVRGPYFSVLTLLVALVTGLAVKNSTYLGGTSGLFLPFPRVPIEVNRTWFYWAMGGLAVLSTGVSAWVRHSKLGAGLAAIQQNEDVAETLAINTMELKLKALVLSAALAGMVGGLYSYMRSYLSPEIGFDISVSISMFLMALFGGSRTWVGPLVGAAILTVVGEILTVKLGAEAAKISYGLFLMVVILFLPEGVTHLLERQRRARGASHETVL